jgi:hypothetical protein
MTADDDTPSVGHESTDYERGTFPLSEEPDEELAAALRASGSETLAAVEDAIAALEGDETLTDGHLERVSQAAHSVQALTESLVLRVPPEGRADPGAVRPGARGDEGGDRS